MIVLSLSSWIIRIVRRVHDTVTGREIRAAQPAVLATWIVMDRGASGV